MKILKNKASEYKRVKADRFYSITQDQIVHKFSSESVVVTRKVDGEFNLLHVNSDGAVLINQNGVEKRDIPILDKIVKELKKKKISSLTAAVELHLEEDDGRRRIYELMSALSDTKMSNDITISAFDLLELNDKECEFDDHAEMFTHMVDLLDKHVVRHKIVDSHDQISKLFDEWVIEENSEGLVVHTLSEQVYKIKPVHTLDLAIVGYSAENERIRSILLAFMREDGSLQQVAKVGSGLNEELGRDLYKTLSKNHVQSSYIVTDKNNVAFQMVNPEVVIEIRVNDVISQTTKGVIKNPLLVLEDGMYIQQGQVEGVSFIHPVFIHIREDKKVNKTDIRLSQVSELVHIDTKIAVKPTERPASSVMLREVYTKASKGSTMIQKFMVWQTNKSSIDEVYPEYVFCYINYSPTRKDQMKKEIRISSSEEQILEICEEYKSKNIKKGWANHESG